MKFIKQGKQTLLALFMSLSLVNYSFAAGIPTIDVGSLTQSILSYQESLQSNTLCYNLSTYEKGTRKRVSHNDYRGIYGKKRIIKKIK